uniref:Inorganic pyrophosphatase n=1 Tax=Schistocephalus solidus TaxID=70667 RepID=A0A0X3NUU3_SCHSO
MMSHYSNREFGASNSTDYRMYIMQQDQPISPFHDIPLVHSPPSIMNMVVEIPRWSNAKMEICKEEILNPIKQDVKKGKLRFVNNVFPHKGYIWNYGALPQTWEDPSHVDPDTKSKGDNDPIDVCEIGSRILARGSIVPVKILGILAMIDEGETDWKVIAIHNEDPLAVKLNDIDDVEKHMPGFLQATREWFRNYKVPTGKPKNEFAFDGNFKNREFALKIVNQTHEQWKKLVTEKTDFTGLYKENISVQGSPYQIPTAEGKNVINKLPEYKEGEPISDPAVEEVCFV